MQRTLSAQAEPLDLEHIADRAATVPAAVGGFLAAAVTLVRRRALEPAMPRMSNDWLNTFDRFGGGRFDG